MQPDASPARDGQSLAAALIRSRDDPRAFALVYQACSQNVLLFLTRRTYDAEVALELTAETFARAFAMRRRFKGEVDAEAQAWLYGIARRLLWRWFRRGSVERKALDALEMQVPAMPEDEQERVEELAGLGDIRAAIGVELARLPLEQREALRLRVVEERSYADVARRLDISEQAARARVFRALRALARALDGLEGAR